jgi:hypothetical protein
MVIYHTLMLEVGFYALLAFIVSGLCFVFRVAALSSGMVPRQASAVFRNSFFFFIAWTVYLSIMVKAGMFRELKSPPSIVLFAILPAFTVITIVNVAKRFRYIFDHSPVEWILYLQGFRIFVELLIHAIYKKGLGPVETTYEGYNFDIVSGITAILLARAYSKRLVSKKLVILWNIFGLLLLVNIVTIFNTLILKPRLWGYSETPIHPDFATMPYLLIAGVFMPVAVFMHILCIRRCLRGVA